MFLITIDVLRTDHEQSARWKSFLPHESSTFIHGHARSRACKRRILEMQAGGHGEEPGGARNQLNIGSEPGAFDVPRIEQVRDL